jgi:TrmH family RNA methyltransferase
MISITSSSNEKIKRIRLLTTKVSARREEGVFVAEGTKLVTEAPADRIREIYVSESCLGMLGITEDAKGKDASESAGLQGAFLKLAEALPEEAIIKLPDHLFEKISTMKTPQGMLAVMKAPEYSFEDVRGAVAGSSASGQAGAERAESGPGAPLILVLEDIQDPGNVGTIFRTAEAAGVSGIILSESSADPLSPKTVRSTMGAIFRVPFIVSGDMPGMVKRLESGGIACYAARLDESAEYDKCRLDEPCALLIGNEGNGLSKEITEAASHGIYIPMSGKTESLNAAISASILAYEARRQRCSK